MRTGGDFDDARAKDGGRSQAGSMPRSSSSAPDCSASQAADLGAPMAA